MNEEAGAGGAPAWMVTFGDMMALLLTFFIMIASFSELKSEEKYQALLDAFQHQFGHHRSDVLPGGLRARNAALVKLAALGRAKRMDTMPGNAKVQSPTGDYHPVPALPPGSHTGAGTVLYFPEQPVER
jgi:chemotaxis protein MotB